jgi:hypothetical protein
MASTYSKPTWLLCRVEGHLQGLSNTNTYNVLHLRAEEDWIAYCAVWERRTASGRRSSC